MHNDFIPNEFKDKKSIVDTFLNIDKFITPKIIKIVYFLFLIFLALTFVAILLTGLVNLFQGNIFSGLLLIILSPIIMFFNWILIRVNVELTIVAFKNNEYLKKISEK